MSSEVLISIAMTCFNQARFITEAMSSITKQTYHNWELVIINDCSTDKSLKIIGKSSKKLQIENKVKLYNNDKNVGYSVSLDRAIRKSSGELVAIVDADDALLDAFEACVEAVDADVEALDA